MKSAEIKKVHQFVRLMLPNCYYKGEQEMLHEIPAGRFGDPSEIASLAAFLATPAAAYINGTSIPVDGGRTAAI